jgi:hypothetical protein
VSNNKIPFDVLGGIFCMPIFKYVDLLLVGVFALNMMEHSVCAPRKKATIFVATMVGVK